MAIDMRGYGESSKPKVRPGHDRAAAEGSWCGTGLGRFEAAAWYVPRRRSPCSLPCRAGMRTA